MPAYDDGKRFDALDVAGWSRGLLKGGSLREGVGKILPVMEDLADDGKRFDALGVVVRAGGCNRGGSPREGSG